MECKHFGYTAGGAPAMLYCLRNSGGMMAEITDFGATLCGLWVPGPGGTPIDVVLGYDSPAAYEQAHGTFFGATVGRSANRIGNARFTLNGQTWFLTPNDGSSNLHSGPDCYSLRIWKVKSASENAVAFCLHSPHMDQGFPGALDVDVTYTLTEDNSLRIDYCAAGTADTVVNLTNHSYFNLNGHDSGDILRHTAWVDALRFAQTDSGSVPTGELVSVTGTPMDFTTPKPVGRDIDADYPPLQIGRGYDHNWCLKGGGLNRVAELTGDVSGISMEVCTDMPGVQIYTANYVNNEPGKRGAVYPRRAGICFETQFYPDAVNHPEFPSPILKAGEIFRSTTIYRFR